MTANRFLQGKLQGSGSGSIRICVMGLGQVGLPTSKYFQDCGLDVWGYDISHDAVERAQKQGLGKATVDWDEIPLMDVYVLCVSTTLEKGKAVNLTPVFESCARITEKVDANAHQTSLVAIESTIVPSTSRKIYNQIFKKKLSLVHIPHRYWAADPLNHGVNQLRVIGAVNKRSLAAGLKLYRDVLGIPLHVASSIEVAEMVKISENACLYVQIAFAEELRMACEDLGLGFEEVREACNTKWNIEVLEAREGIGGHCLHKDTNYLISLTPKNALLEAATTVDRMYKKWWSQKQANSHAQP